MANTKFVFFTELGADIGYGHYVRCSSIGIQLINKGHDVTFVLHCPTPDIAPSEEKFKIVIDDWHQGAEVTSKYLDEDTVVVVDSYLANESVYLEIQGMTQKTVGIYDYAHFRTNPLSIACNPNPYYTENNFKGESFGGTPYILLREAIANWNSQRPIREEIKTAIIMFGGTDNRNLLPAAISRLKLEFPGVHLTVLSGSVQKADELRATFKDQVDLRILEKLDAYEMARELDHADIAISACGQTLGELACLGVPTIGVLIGEDQTQNQAYYVAKGMLKAKLNWKQENLMDELVDAFKNLQDVSKRQELRTKLLKLVDGKGAARTAEFLENI